MSFCTKVLFTRCNCYCLGTFCIQPVGAIWVIELRSFRYYNICMLHFHVPMLTIISHWTEERIIYYQKVPHMLRIVCIPFAMKQMGYTPFIIWERYRTSAFSMFWWRSSIVRLEQCLIFILQKQLLWPTQHSTRYKEIRIFRLLFSTRVSGYCNGTRNKVWVPCIQIALSRFIRYHECKPLHRHIIDIHSQFNIHADNKFIYSNLHNSKKAVHFSWV